jgi:hypothetical protein
MLNPTDLYTYAIEEPLTDGGTQYGTAYISYEARQMTDVRGLACARGYVVSCALRIVVPNASTFQPGPAANAYMDYPALLTSQMAVTPSDPASSGSLRLLTYVPRTLNTSVMTTANESAAETQSSSVQHTTGSSTSQTNSYSASISLGPSPSVSGEYGHSQTDEHSDSDSTGSEHGGSAESGSSDSMSIKDWGSYAFLDVANTTPTWVWAQEFPWDLIQFHYCGPDGVVGVPKDVKERCWDSDAGLVLPPSHLALFGVDFVMKASWQLTLSQGADETVTVDHALEYVRGSHHLNDASTDIVVTIDTTPLKFAVTSPPLDLTLLGLDPVQGPGTANGAVIGFIPNKFVTPPPSAGSAFKILSDTNTLQVTGNGFADALSTDFTHGQVALTVQFKVADHTYDYALFLKHWNTSAVGCTLELVFNGDTANPVYRHVDAMEGEGGDDNLDVVNLRNRDYTSIDYHDYLTWGLNTVVITVTPDDASSPGGYVLRAVAIGES